MRPTEAEVAEARTRIAKTRTRCQQLAVFAGPSVLIAAGGLAIVGASVLHFVGLGLLTIAFFAAIAGMMEREFEAHPVHQISTLDALARVAVRWRNLSVAALLAGVGATLVAVVIVSGGRT